MYYETCNQIKDLHNLSQKTMNNLGALNDNKSKTLKFHNFNPNYNDPHGMAGKIMSLFYIKQILLKQLSNTKFWNLFEMMIRSGEN